jgi:hypothetical protein
MTGNTLNIVYDYWDGMKPIPNGKTQYPKKHFWDIEDFVCSYVNSLSKVEKLIVKNCKISDVYENLNQKYYYFICHATMDIDEIIKDNLIINNEIKECLRLCNNFNLVFFSNHESDREDGFLILNNSDLPKNQIYIMNNNYKLNEYVNKHNSKINVHSVMYLPVVVSITLPHMDSVEFTFDRKERLFMCFNRGQKIHRYSLLVFMLKNNLLGDTNWSLIPNNIIKYSYEDYEKIFEYDDIEIYKNEIEIFNDLKLKVSDHEKTELSFNDKNEITVLNPKYTHLLLPPDFPLNYSNSYINIVTETKFLDNENVIQISEKSFKPFYHYQFPMILATHHHIKSLKEKYGFDFFDDIIDHSYDNEQDQKKRFDLFVKEIKRLHDNKENIIEFYRNNRHRFIRNKNKVIAIKNDKSDYVFFKTLLG